MQRTLTQSPDLSGTPLAELKQWLGISRDDEDALLLTLLQSSLSLCEAFTGLLPLEVEVEERLPSEADDQMLTSQPVRSLVAVERLGEAGASVALGADDYTFAVDPAGRATLSLTQAWDGEAVVVRVTAGLAADWSNLPAALRQGIIRLAAFHYRDRDQSGPPPASVAALWRPWRQVRLT